MAGRPRKSKAEKELLGTFRADRHEVQASDSIELGMPLPTAKIKADREALRLWTQICVAAQSKLSVNEWALMEEIVLCKMECDSYRDDIDNDGRYQNVVTREGSKLIKLHPAIPQLNISRRHLADLLNMIGLTPASRSRIIQEPVPEEAESNPFDKF